MNDNILTDIIDDDGNSLQRIGNRVSIRLDQAYYNAFKQIPNSLDGSLFLTSLDVEEINRKTYELSTTIDSSYQTLSQIKRNILIDADNSYSDDDYFVKESIKQTIIPVLELVLALQEQKTWDIPLHPQNIIVDVATGSVKGIFRYPQGTQVDNEFLDDIERIIYYLLTPLSDDKLNSAWKSEPYIEWETSDFIDLLSADEILKEVNIEVLQNIQSALIEINDNLFDGNERTLDIKGALEAYDANEEIDQVEFADSVIDIDTTPPVEVADEEPYNDEETSDDEYDDEEPLEDDFEDATPPKKQLKEKVKQKKQPKPKNKKQGSGNKKVLIIGGVIVGIVLAILCISAVMTSNNQSKTEDSTKTAQVSSKPVEKQDASKNTDFYNGTLASGNGNYAKAVNDFNKFFSDTSNRNKYIITKDEKTTVYVAYSKANQYQQLLDKMTPFDKMTPVTLTNYLLLENQKDKVNSLQSNNKYIKFAKAYIANNKNGMIENANANLSTNKDMAIACGKAFGESGDLSGAKDWLQSLSNDDVQKQATQAVIDSAKAKGMNVDEIKKTLGVNE